MQRALVVTDSPIIAAGMRVLLEAGGEAELVGVAEDAVSLESGLAGGVDVVLVDLSMRDGAALPLVWWLHDHAPGVEVIGLSDDDEAIVAALRAGARGSLSRRASAADLAQAIRTIRQGGLVLDPIAAARLLQQLQATRGGRRVEPLTPREIEVLRLLVEGLTNKAIAARLGISDHTVKFHIGAIMGKLGAASRTEAVTMAVRQGLIPL